MKLWKNTLETEVNIFKGFSLLPIDWLMMSEGATRASPNPLSWWNKAMSVGAGAEERGWKFSADLPHSASIVSMLLYQTGLRSMSYSYTLSV